MQPKVSVIIPMYNVSEYVEECFINLASQDLTDFEVVLIDDRSVDDTIDKTVKAIERFERKDVEFTLITQETNMGVACARNKGLERASGEYIYFYDADDRLEPDTLSTLYAEAKFNDDEAVC